MRAVVQRVAASRVEIGGETVGEIGQGLMILLGVIRGGYRGGNALPGEEDRQPAHLHR